MTENLKQTRDTVFLSHANPEDNEFTRWLASKLLQHGYRVFCDLVDFKGGEDFWQVAEKTIRLRAAKVIYVLSALSNSKVGPLNELRVASNVGRTHDLRDFIIPMGIDDLPHRDANIEIARLNIISASDNWAVGLRKLLSKLEEDKVPRCHEPRAASSTPQWRDPRELSSETINVSEEYVSNWFPIVDMPSRIFFHSFSRVTNVRHVAGQLPVPGTTWRNFIITFADPFEMAKNLPLNLSLAGSTERPIIDGRIAGGRELLSRQMGRHKISELLRIGFGRLCVERGLVRYTMANRAQCLFFPRGLVSGDKVHFQFGSGRGSWRKVVGHKSRMSMEGKRRTRYWHFGVQARPIFDPMPVFSLTPHVLFSDDGKNIWRDKGKLSRARRSQCKDWWNDDWRDRLLGVMDWLAVDGIVSLPISRSSSVAVSASPVAFDSPVSYRDPGAQAFAVTEEMGVTG